MLGSIFCSLCSLNCKEIALNFAIKLFPVVTLSIEFFILARMYDASGHSMKLSIGNNYQSSLILRG